MNLVVERANALSAISRVVGVVERRHTIMILANVALSAEEGRLSLRGTDLEMEAIEHFPANVSETGEITIPADKLHDIVRASDPGAQVTVATDDGNDMRVKVKSGRSNYKVPSLPATDFPTFDGSGLGAEFTMPAALLADMIGRVAWSSKKSEKASVLECVYLTTVDDQILTVACSGYTMAVRREPKPEGADIAVMLPLKFVSQVTKWLGELTGDVMVSSSEKLVRIRHESGQLTSKLLDFEGYVDYTRILLDTHDLTAATDQDALKAAVRRALIMADSKARSIRIDVSDGALSVQSHSAHAGEGVDEIAADYEGPAVSLLLSADYFEGALANLKGDGIEISFAPEARDKDVKSIQVVIRAPADPGYLVNLAQPRA